MSFEEQWGIPLVEAVEGLDAQLRVLEQGRVICCIGLLATFYYDCEISEARQRAVSSYELYRRATGDKLIWGADPKTQRPKKIAGTDIGDVRAWAPRVSLVDEFGFTFHGGKNKNDADPYMISALPVRPSRRELSVFTFSLPIAWAAARPPGSFIQLVTEISAIIRPEHGYAGLGIIPHVNQSYQGREMTAVVGLAKRFRGLEIDFPFIHAIFLEEKPAIKGINWLTILGETWVTKLGGATALRARLSNEIAFHPYAGGVVIQAGDKPLFGDVNASEPMPRYEEVARALKPIRTQDIRSISTQFGLNREATTAWLNRFG